MLIINNIKYWSWFMENLYNNELMQTFKKAYKNLSPCQKICQIFKLNENSQHKLVTVVLGLTRQKCLLYHQHPQHPASIAFGYHSNKNLNKWSKLKRHHIHTESMSHIFLNVYQVWETGSSCSGKPKSRAKSQTLCLAPDQSHIKCSRPTTVRLHQPDKQSTPQSCKHTYTQHPLY